MPWIPEEEIKRAREITAIEYLKKYQPNRLKKSSARNEWELTDHDSFKINEQTSQWHWKSRDIGGTMVFADDAAKVNRVMDKMNLDFVRSEVGEAVHEVTEGMEVPKTGDGSFFVPFVCGYDFGYYRIFLHWIGAW